MKNLRQGTSRNHGFTIVELLIVIVVIAILAAVAVVAYNGIQERAKNAKTVAAIEGYARLVALYKVDHGDHPDATSCLGVGYPGGVCRNDSASWAEDGDQLNSVLLAPYLNGSPPTPALVTSAYNSSLTITGVFYDYKNSAYNPDGGGLGAVMLGLDNCPSIAGTTYVNNTATIDGNRLCRYAFN